MKDRERMNYELDCESVHKIKMEKYNDKYYKNHNESDIRDCLDINNFNMNLNLICRECRVLSGWVDILCEDMFGNKIPIEIKKGTARDSAIGQILGYMKALKTEDGFIVARDFSKRLVYIAEDYNIKLFYYKVYESDENNYIIKLDELNKRHELYKNYVY